MNSITHEVTHLDGLLRRAALFGEAGRWREAIPLLQSALLTEPDNARLYCRMAQAQFQINELSRAMGYVEQAISLNPTYVWAHQIRCTILLKGSKPRVARRAAEEMLALNPNDAASLSLMTRALLKSNKSIRARKTAERLRQIAPNFSQTHESFVLVALNQRHWQEAEAHCREMLRINPLSSAAFNNLGLALRGLNRGPEAIQYLLEAQRLNPASQTTRRALRGAIKNYLFGSEVLFYLLIGAVGCLIVALAKPHGGATDSPLWLHITLFMLAPVFVGAAILVVRHRLQRLPPAARQYIVLQKRRWNDR